MAACVSAVICKTVHLLRCSLLAVRRNLLCCTGWILLPPPAEDPAPSGLGMEAVPSIAFPSPSVDIRGLTGIQEKKNALNIYVCTYMPIELCSEQKSCSL